MSFWIFIPKSSMYPPHAPRRINPSADEQQEAGRKTQRVPLGVRRDGEILNLLSHPLLLPSRPPLPRGSPRRRVLKVLVAGDRLVPPQPTSRQVLPHGDAFTGGKERPEEAAVTRAACGLGSKCQHLSLSLSQPCSKGNLICL